MVNNKNTDEVQDDIEIDNDTVHTDTTDPELSDIEDVEENKLKTLKTKLKEAEEKNRDLHEELQRTKADFLNARKRLEDERAKDKSRQTINHIEKLLPVCDSFYLAMLDKDAWALADEKWRKGVEGILSQLNNVLSSYNITSYNPLGTTFDHARHEALSMIPVTDESQNNVIISVIQLGYEISQGDSTELIRPARVAVGEYTN
jgi:molecular chaperone GrpE